MNGSAKMRTHMNKKYEDFVAGLPSYFRVGSTVALNSTGPMAAIPVQRWMLHQQLWCLFLRLDRASRSSQNDRASCQLLAQNIIKAQAQIQARCAVCSTLSTNETQLFNAPVVLLVDLLSSSKHKDADRSGAQLSRLMTRDKIQEAIELFRTRSDAEALPVLQDPRTEWVKGHAQRSVMALEALMKLEEEESSNNRKSSVANLTENRVGGSEVRSESGARTSLPNKVVDVLEALQGNAKNAAAAMEQADLNSFSALDMSMPVSTAIDGFQDLDVLPVLSNDPSGNFWHFSDFTTLPQSSTENGFFSAAADSQTPLGSMPSMPSSDMAYSLSSFGTPEFADVYSNSEDTRVTHTSPWSTESGPTKLSGDIEAATRISSTDAYVAAKFSWFMLWAMVPFPPCSLDHLKTVRGLCIMG